MLSRSRKAIAASFGARLGCCLWLLFASFSQASNTIDPDGTGANDVVLDPFSAQTPILNPLTDPFDLGDEDLAVGNTALGALRIDNGSSLLNRHGDLGYQPGSVGMVTIHGSGSEWENTGLLGVGYEGVGVLDIEFGGSLISANSNIASRDGSTGVVALTGAGSRWSSGSLTVGDRGTGILTIGSQTSVTSGSTSIGNRDGSRGEVTVNGTGATWTNVSRLNIGSIGDGTLNITDGGSVTSRSGSIAQFSGSSGSVTVDGLGSIWQIDDQLTQSPQGALNIANGGTVVTGREARLNASLVLDEGTLTTGTLEASPRHIFGTGTINASGLVSDIDLTFDDNNGLTKTILLSELPGQNVTINLAVDGTGNVGVGFRGSATMNVADGFVLNSAIGIVGSNPGSSGDVTIEGAGSTWASSGSLLVGHQGTGRLAVTGGATLTSSVSEIGYLSASQGQVTIDGAGSSWANGSLNVGRSGNGRLIISNGGTVTSNAGYVGRENYSSGRADVTGIGSRWDVGGELRVSSRNTGVYDGTALSIRDGGSVTADNFHLGASFVTEALVAIDGPGSSLTIEDALIAGNGAVSRISISHGGALSAGRVFIGNTGSTHSTVDIDGAGSTFTSNAELIVGRFRPGKLNVTDGANVENIDGFVGLSSHTSSIVNVDGTGSTWSNLGDLKVGGKGVGLLNITGGGLVRVDGTLTIGPNWSGDPESFVSMATGGMLAIAGDIDDSIPQFLDNIPHITSRDVLRYWDETLGFWAPMTDAIPDEDFTLDYLTTGDLAGYTLLTVGELPSSPGDYNNDGIVDTADYNLWRDNLGSNLALPGETVTPGEVTQEDLFIWRNNFGASSASTPNSVPEPSSVLLMSMMGLMFAGRLRVVNTTRATPE